MPNPRAIRPVIAVAILAAATLAAMVVLAFAASGTASADEPRCIAVTTGLEDPWTSVS